MMALLMGLKSISPAHLQGLIHEGRVVVVDVNVDGQWARAHVPGAIHLDHLQFSADNVSKDRATTVVFYCSNPLCRKAPIAAKRAKQMGFSDVRVMSAGIKGWLSAGLATDSGS